MGSDPRIGYHVIYPGAGYGGSCFPKDVRALAKSAADTGYTAELMEAVESINNRQKQRLFDKISTWFDGKLKDRTIALWGLSFKPKTDDMREASSRTLMEALWAAGANVRAYDPEAMEETRRLYPDEKRLELCESAQAALEGADALAIMTEWQEFRSPDFPDIKQKLKSPVIFDGRNLYDPKFLASLGFSYFGIGRSGTPRA
jgi:UDPglucose 6-dehydrogenase